MNKMNHTDNQSEPSMQIVVSVKKDGSLDVSGFPKNLVQAMQVIDAARGAIVNYFIEHAKAGHLDDTGTVIESNIIQPKFGMSVPDIMRRNQNGN
jgi:hypothetical protein